METIWSVEQKEMKMNRTSWDPVTILRIMQSPKETKNKEQEVFEETMADDLCILMNTDLNGQATNWIPT